MTTQSDPRVDEYIAQFPELAQQRMHVLRKIIRRTFPTAIEDISYKMPAYRLEAGKMPVVFFGAYEKHIGVYAVLTPQDTKLYKQIEPYNNGKGTLRFDNNKPLPVVLIEQVLAHQYVHLIK
ncbi:MAG: hypothetical protein JWO54_785 [Candidatus Saccharibacteria bacterium]|nr:hypothetical protein [Candidatus Saccharibacteria bacterium]MDB5181022.1 hypothetical protein [Candidatus Saccharibacteria bacterium]